MRPEFLDALIARCRTLLGRKQPPISFYAAERDAFCAAVCELGASVARLRDELETEKVRRAKMLARGVELSERLTDIIDDEFGLQPVEDLIDDQLTALKRLLSERGQREHAACRQRDEEQRRAERAEAKLADLMDDGSWDRLWAVLGPLAGSAESLSTAARRAVAGAAQAEAWRTAIEDILLIDGDPVAHTPEWVGPYLNGIRKWDESQAAELDRLREQSAALHSLATNPELDELIPLLAAIRDVDALARSSEDSEESNERTE